jgi:hypothetical protein
MKIHCLVCGKAVTVRCSIEGFSITEQGFEPDGHYLPPPPPWIPVLGGRLGPMVNGYVCGEICEALHLEKDNVWQCGECGEKFLHEGRPEECPKCGHYHCGDDQCCYGEMFEQLYLRFMKNDQD